MMRVVIIGGGAVGSSTACHLAREPGFTGEITVIERDPTYRIASSSLSASSIRQQFSTPVNVAMSQYGFAFLREAGRLLAVDGEAANVTLIDRAYLFLADEAGLDTMRATHRVQREAGADVALLTPGEIKARFPWIATEGVAAGTLGLSGEGWFDGPGLLAAYRRKARALGVTYLAQDATGLVRDGDRVTGVTLADGAAVPCDVAVNAAGPWSARVAAWAGIDLPVRPRKRMIYVFRIHAELPGCPLLIDHSGNFMRPEGPGFICGRSPGAGEPDPDEPPLVVEDDMFMDRVWPALAARVPALETLKLTGSWAGYYELNLWDYNGFIGPHPACPNLVMATGFSGHGMQHSPATGRGVAELVAHGGFTTLDLSPLATARLAEGRKVIELGIV
jgi:glycine/D-amino acid oxidase-like deaminating enzyme